MVELLGKLRWVERIDKILIIMESEGAANA